MEYPKVKPCLNTSENDLVQELYQPCLQWASRFDRGVGYFTTGWLSHNVAGLSDFASRGGVMRLITRRKMHIIIEGLEKAFNISLAALLLSKKLFPVLLDSSGN